MGKFFIFQFVSVHLRNLWLNNYIADHNHSRTKSCVRIECATSTFAIEIAFYEI